MRREFVSTEVLERLARGYLRLARGQLEARGAIVPVFVLLDSVEGAGDEIVVVPPEAMRDDRAKRSMFDSINAKIAQRGFTAVLHMADANTMKLESGERGNFEALRRLGVSFKEISERFGVGKFREAAVLTVETIDGRGFGLRLNYSRREGRIEFGEIEETRVLPTADSLLRFFGKEAERGVEVREEEPGGKPDVDH